MGSGDETRGGAKWTEGRAFVSTQCACSERLRGKYKKLEHSKGIYFPTLMFSQRSLGDRKEAIEVNSDGYGGNAHASIMHYFKITFLFLL